MADIHCKEPGCDAIIADPCVKTSGLFLTKMDLVSKASTPQVQSSIAAVNNILENELGLESHEEKFQAFSIQYNLLRAPLIQTMTFTLECFRGHRNQYTITCND